MVFKVLSTFLSFFREIVFDSKEEHNFTSYEFNTRKVMVLCMIVLSLGMNLFLMERIYSIANKLVDTRLELTSLQDDYKNLNNSCKKNIPSSSSDEVIKPSSSFKLE